MRNQYIREIGLMFALLSMLSAPLLPAMTAATTTSMVPGEKPSFVRNNPALDEIWDIQMESFETLFGITDPDLVSPGLQLFEALDDLGGYLGQNLQGDIFTLDVQRYIPIDTTGAPQSVGITVSNMAVTVGVISGTMKSW